MEERTVNGDGVRRHHLMLQRWLADADDAALAEFVGAHADEFTLVTTRGAVLTRVAMLETLRSAGGSQPGLKIEIAELSSPAPGAVRFLETHHLDGRSAQRRVTALVDGNTWLSIHETTVR